MHFPFLHLLHPITNDIPGEHQLVVLHKPDLNTSDGGEFLDDALRMEDIDTLLPSTDEQT